MNKLRCKPGDRAKIIRAVCPGNIGLVVVVVRPYDIREVIEGSTWVSGAAAWVVVAVGRPLAGLTTKGVIELNRTGVCEDVNLVPLDDDDAGTGIAVSKRKPMTKKQTADTLMVSGAPA